MRTVAEQIDLDVFRKYAGLSLPRHVSYPMPTWWEDVDAGKASAMLRERCRWTPMNDLSLYLHIPFCERLCRYCACTRIVQRRDAEGAAARTAAYVTALECEIRGLRETLGGGNRVRQIHWGGGTPTYLSVEQIERLHEVLSEVFAISPEAEVAMELDPRVTTVEMLETLRRLGFNRASLGVQDFDQQVQEHVQRIQSPELVQQMVQACRQLGFESINFDLIYGLPYQTVQTVQDTIAKTIAMSPNRIAFYHYAQIPDKIATQRGLDYSRLPDSETKLEMFLLGLRMFTEAGYVFIGLDHFAKPDEALAVALRDGTLQRTFQGMTTGGNLDLIGLGATAISHVKDVGFLQNVHNPGEYTTCVNSGASAIRRGKRFTLDDRVRQAVMRQLYCTAEIRPEAIERQFDLAFSQYFAREIAVMRELEADGLVELRSDGVIATTLPLGRVLMRTIAAVFDAYLAPDAYRVGDQHCYSANA
jgi:oxygen-independent coproporphyrinogen-3 oxidase